MNFPTDIEAIPPKTNYIENANDMNLYDIPISFACIGIKGLIIE